MKHFFTYIILFFSVQCVVGQSGYVKKALKQLEKGEYQKVEEFINKSLEKDSLYPGAFYTRSALLFTQGYEGFKIDSAYRDILFTQVVYDSLDEKERNRHVRLGIDLLSIDSLKRSIDRAAFERAFESDKEQDYIFFLTNFPTASQVNMAIGLRNERAFQKAVAENTYQSYKSFMEKYPKARQLEEAEKRYEKLYFTKSTADNKLKSYQQFLDAHPTTPYRKEAEQRIYEVITADHSIRSYLRFLGRYSQSFLKDKAIDFMFHVAAQNQSFNQVPKQYLSDSLIDAQFDPSGFMIPFLKNKKYGFIDDKGEIIQDAKYNEIDESQICGGLKQDFYVADEKLYGRNGALIYDKPFKQVTDLGYGILTLKSEGQITILHKSGRVIIEGVYEDVKLLAEKFLALKNSNQWDIYTVEGISVTQEGFDNIIQEGQFLLFEKNGQYDIKNSSQLVAVVDENRIRFDMIFDDYELLDETAMWLQSSYGEVVYNNQLTELISYDSHEVSWSDSTVTVQKDGVWEVYDSTFQSLAKFDFDKFWKNEKWIVYKKDTSWHLVDADNFTQVTHQFDSLSVLGSYFAIGFAEEQQQVLTLGQSIPVKPSEDKLSLISSLNSSQYLLLTPEESRRQSIIYDAYGRTIFQSKFDNLSAVDDIGLTFAQRGKKGMIAPMGEYLLRPKYDAIASMGNGLISILQKKKFGLYDVNNGVLIPPKYERNIIKYSDDYYVAQLDGGKVIVDKDNQRLSDDTFEAVKYWNDTSALVKQDFIWKHYDFKKGELSEVGIKSLQSIKDTPEEQILIVLIDNAYGLWSSARGEIIAPTFNDILNVGTVDIPIYFTEKHIEEAEFYVVIYYDSDGELIFKTAIEAEDYPLIYCDN